MNSEHSFKLSDVNGQFLESCFGESSAFQHFPFAFLIAVCKVTSLFKIKSDWIFYTYLCVMTSLVIPFFSLRMFKIDPITTTVYFKM